MNEVLFQRVYEGVVARSGEYDHIWYTCVKTTGIFCRPICPAKTPFPANVEFKASAKAALHAGFRPCKRCKPLDRGESMPEWVGELRDRLETLHGTRLKDQDLRNLGLCPIGVRRAFKKNFGMTFHDYQRAFRMGTALAGLRAGEHKVDAAIRTGYKSESGFRNAFEQVIGSSIQVPEGSELAWAKWIETPIGDMVLVVSDAGLGLLEFVDRPMLETQFKRYVARTGRKIIPGFNDLTDLVEQSLHNYFSGDLSQFNIPLDLAGTNFQIKVWNELISIPLGETRSYQQQASRIGNSDAVRAVGRANGDNRIAIIVPCHRVIGADGSLTGYGGGIWRKKWLLNHEKPGRELRDN